jgi:hypothetical protein
MILFIFINLPSNNETRLYGNSYLLCNILPCLWFLSSKYVAKTKSVILATQEAKIRRISVQSKPGQIVWHTLFSKKKSQEKAGRVVQGVGPEFKPQYCKKKKKNLKKQQEKPV